MAAPSSASACRRSSTAELIARLDRVHAHLRAYLEAVASLPGGELHERGGIVHSTAPIGWPMFNGALAIPEAGSCDAAAAVAAELAAGGRPWFWWVLPDTPE